MPKSPLTEKGAERLRLLLAELKAVRRPQIIRAIAEARAHGDLSENAEYHAAREQQSFVEGRIGALESLLANAQIIDVAGIKAAPRIVFGATVDLLNMSSAKPVTYQIVGEEEADINLGLISVSSPIARALIGKEEGEVAGVNAPGGIIEYEIVSVRYI
ncbi:MAG: transcription elongation factor GreA [Gammaproteobacteria bacterium]|nr:transcription elongation factor GreA [Gammaproteobacteria bacterium]